MIEITEKPIDVAEAIGKASAAGAGSLVIHVGVVKPVVDDRKTQGMKLVADGDPAAEMEKVEARLRSEFDLRDVVLIRRLGELGVGDVILVAAVSARKKDVAFAACERAIDMLKEKRGLKKEELFEE